MEKEHEVDVESSQRQEAREQFIAAMLENRTFGEASAGAPPPVKRAMAYRLLRAVRIKGNVARPRWATWAPTNCATRCDR